MRETAFALSQWLEGERANTEERRTIKMKEQKSVRRARESERERERASER